MSLKKTGMGSLKVSEIESRWCLSNSLATPDDET